MRFRWPFRKRRLSAEPQIGARICELRHQKRWTQLQLSHQSGISTQTLSRIENGVNRPREKTLRSIAVALGVSSEDLASEYRA